MSWDADALVGRQVGMYRVDAVLGAGAMGVVVRATHLLRGEHHALKLVQHQHPRWLPRFARERLLQDRVHHPNVVRALGQFEHDRHPVLVLEYVDGPNLQRHLTTRGPLSLADVDRLARGVLAGVAAAHAQGVVHRDLKPENVLVGRDGTPKVSDFGLARQLGGRDPSLTRTHARLGTPRYMAPEQWLDAKRVDERADVFSLGCLLYELATGRAAFPQNDLLALGEAIAGGRFVPPQELRADLPACFRVAILAALAPDLDARPRDVGRLRRLWCGAPWAPPELRTTEPGALPRTFGDVGRTVIRVDPDLPTRVVGAPTIVPDREPDTVLVPPPPRSRRDSPVRPLVGLAFGAVCALPLAAAIALAGARWDPPPSAPPVLPVVRVERVRPPDPVTMREEPPPRASGQLNVQMGCPHVGWAWVTVDGAERGVAPMRRTVAAGMHEVRVVTGAGEQLFAGRAWIEPGGHTVVRACGG